ncbi:MAG: glycosyltransferase [Pseudomonadota bacterium]
MTHIACVVPVLNEAPNIDELVTRLSAALEGISPDHQILIVDDGSRDETWPRLKAHAARDPRIEGIRLSRNFGQHTAITAGLDAADADWVVVLDGDLQDRPEVIPDLYAKAQEGHDVVFVEREDRPEGKLYMAAQRLFYRTLRGLTDTAYDGAHGNFSIISRTVLTRYQELSEGGRFYGGLVDWLGFERVGIRAKHGARFAGAPSYNLFKRLRFAKNIVLSFSTKPLDLTLSIGLVVTVAALLFGCVILFRAFFFGYAIEGWASIMVSIYFLGGVQMVMIGMVGLYVGRISEEVKRRPGYVTRERLSPATARTAVTEPASRLSGLSVVE